MAKKKHSWICPQCGATCTGTAGWQARLRLQCRACTRVSTGWSCRECGSTDPHHPFPCPAPPERGSALEPN